MINLPLWQEYVERRSGFVLPTSQQNWLIYAVESTAKSMGISVGALYTQISQDKTTEQALFDKLLIAETRFFRHQESLEFVLKAYEAHLSKQSSSFVKQKFRVWSAGCSTGQEVYSVAMGLQLTNDRYPNPATYQITGSDLSEKSLNIAKMAQYVNRDIQSVPIRYRHYLQEVKSDESHDLLLFGQKNWQITPKITQHTQFFWQNLFLKTPIDIPKQDVILCQNVLIYFRKFDQRDMLAYLVQYLNVGGYLVLAPNEMMTWQHPKMRQVEHECVHAWQKVIE